MNKIAVLFLLLVGSLVLGACTLTGGGQNNPSPMPEAVVTGAMTVDIQNFAFSPGTLTIKKDATVTWTNNDSAPHQIKSNTFNSSQLANGQSYSFTFNTVGTFDYSCSIHPSMTGKIIVE
jgi:plastocyanin